MASKTEIEELILTDESLETFDLDSSDFCSDCLYDWCTIRSSVVFCTMKTRGLFECKKCIMKLSNSTS
ncbi:MAG TPA: hypothetical protein VMZ29_14500 [Candidatus Bathyarchaeia archaeon]|nr:hypothetical protein [Candidatus Bathyarchaeia archaeon]